MAKEGQARLDALAGAARSALNEGRSPAHRWNQSNCGEIDMRIGADGTWYYQNTPISRPALVKLFASILRREGDRYFLVTPAEKCAIIVEDAPFLAVELKLETRDVGQGDPSEDRVLRFRTNVDEWVACGPEHPLRFEPEIDTGGLKPYLLVRDGLWAKVTRPLFYELVALGEEREVNGVPMFGVVSQGLFFPMAPMSSIQEMSE